MNDIHTCKVTVSAAVHKHLEEGMGRVALGGVGMTELEGRSAACRESLGSMRRESRSCIPFCSCFVTCLTATSSPVFSNRAKYTDPCAPVCVVSMYCHQASRAW